MGCVRAVKLHVTHRTLYELSEMFLMKSVPFVVFEILRSLVSMQITAEISKISKTVQRDPTFIFDELSEDGIGFVSNSVLSAVKNVISFMWNEFSRKWGCVTMRDYAETFCSVRSTKWRLKFWHRYRNVRISFFWGQLHVTIVQKPGASSQVSWRKWISALWPSRWRQKNRGEGGRMFQKCYYMYMTYLSHDFNINTKI